MDDRVEVTDPETGEVTTIPLAEFLKAQFTDPLVGFAHLDSSGAEVGNPTPIAPPIGYKKQKSMFDHMRDLIRGEALKAAAESAGAESFDDADDFDVPDEVDPSSVYEGEYEPFKNVRIRAKNAEAARNAQDPANAELEGIRPSQVYRSRDFVEERPVRPSRQDKVDVVGEGSFPDEIDRGSPPPSGEGEGARGAKRR